MKKTNKTFKRFAAITSASLLAACAVAPVAFNAVAATPIKEGSITITTPESDHSYRAYQIFDGDLSSETVDSVEKITFANIKWGSGVLEKITVDETELTIYDALKNANSAFSKDVPNPDFDDTLEESEENPATINVALTTAEEVSKVLETISPNIPGVTTFAEIDKIAAVFAQFKDTSKTPIVNSAYNSTDKEYVISISDPGYYLVEETSSGSSLAEGEAVTKYLLQVAGNAEVNPKADAPKVMKKVQEDSKVQGEGADGDTVTFPSSDYTLKDGFNDVADYSIGEDINFTLYGSLPTSFANYDAYYYQFTDEMGVGLSLVNINGTGLGKDDFSVTIKDGNKEVTLNHTEDLYTVYIGNDNTFKVILPDLKKIDMDSTQDGIQQMSSNAIITVDYKAELNANAVIGNNGNPNEVYLTYSNNSNTAQGGLNDTNNGPKDEEEVGNTAKDYNVVFTYQLDVTKYLDKADAEHLAAENQAGFKLYNADGQVAVLDSANKFVEWVDSELDANGAETKGTEVKTKADGTFNFIGLQDGTYKLVETTVPTGYNKMDDKTIVITADTSNEITGTCQNYMETDSTKEGMVLTSLTIKVDTEETKNGNIADGTVAMSVINNKGNILPGTGGIGTTIFYLGGGAMAAIGGVYLISKRRMKKSEE